MSQRGYSAILILVAVVAILAIVGIFWWHFMSSDRQTILKNTPSATALSVPAIIAGLQDTLLQNGYQSTSTDTDTSNIVWWIIDPASNGLSVNTTADPANVFGFSINQVTPYTYQRTNQALANVPEIESAINEVNDFMSSHGFRSETNQADIARPSTAFGGFSAAWYSQDSKIRCRLTVNDNNIEIPDPTMRTMPYIGAFACVDDQTYQSAYANQAPLLAGLASYYGANGTQQDSRNHIIYEIPSYVDKISIDPLVKDIEILDLSGGSTNYFTMRKVNGNWIATQGLNGK